MGTATTATAPPPPPVSQATAPALSAQTFKRLHPHAYLDRFLLEGYRPDGRSLPTSSSSSVDSWRDVTVNVGSVSTASGSALVRLGETTIVCGVKAEIFEPDLYSPEEGCIVPNVDLPALCSPKFKPGPPGNEAQILTDRLHRILSDPAVLPLSSLCIHPGKAAWVLYIDAVCINYDGNVWDATLLAVMAALRNTRLPVARYDGEKNRTICARAEPAVPLVLGSRLPVSTTFGVLASKTILPDPTSFEEPLLSSTITAVYLASLSSDKSQDPVMFLEQTGLGGLTGGTGGGEGGGGVKTLGVLQAVVGRGRQRAQVLRDLLG